LQWKYTFPIIAKLYSYSSSSKTIVQYIMKHTVLSKRGRTVMIWKHVHVRHACTFGACLLHAKWDSVTRDDRSSVRVCRVSTSRPSCNVYPVQLDRVSRPAIGDTRLLGYWQGTRVIVTMARPKSIQAGNRCCTVPKSFEFRFGCGTHILQLCLTARLRCCVFANFGRLRYPRGSSYRKVATNHPKICSECVHMFNWFTFKTHMFVTGNIYYMF
jgi:hypothetical protein